MPPMSRLRDIMEDAQQGMFGEDKIRWIGLLRRAAGPPGAS